MKANSPMGKELLEKMKPLKLGETLTLPSFLPGITTTETVGTLTDVHFNEELNKGWWEFALYWFGVRVASVCLELLNGELEAEVLE